MSPFRGPYVLSMMLVARGVFGQSWVVQESHTKADLRGISAVNAMVAWAGGNKGTFLRTTDGGATWVPGVVPEAGDADFRAVHAFSEKSAYLMSAGMGPVSRLYRTDDGGVTWTLVKVNPAAQGFWDGLQMFDTEHGVLLGDPVNGRFTILITEDGLNWNEVKGPPALNGEGAFAASNSSLITRGEHEAWFGTGGPSGGRVFHSDDGGKSWQPVKTPIRHDSESAGIFSLAFAGRRGIAVGGDFTKPKEPTAAIVVSGDGGKSWSAPKQPPDGYHSAVTYLAGSRSWIAVGPNGSDVSADDGQSWKNFDGTAYNAVSFAGDSGWAVGPGGAIASYRGN